MPLSLSPRPGSPSGSRTDSDYTFTGLPSGKTVRVQIVSANDAGQGQPSAAAEMVVP